jgi:hypothetical protein
VCHRYALNMRLHNTSFQRDGTVQLFRTNRQKFLHCPGTKGQQDKPKTCQWTVRVGTACQNPGRDAGRDKYCFSVKIQDGTRDGTIIIFFYDFLFRNIIFCFRTSFPVLERHFSVLECLFSVLESPFPVFFVLFVPVQRSLSRDRGTLKQENCPGTKGQRDVPSRGNASTHKIA